MKNGGKEIINQNLKDDENFVKQVDDFIAGKMPSFETLSLGHTPNIIRLLGSRAPMITMKQNVIRNSMLDESQKANRHFSGHGISAEIIKQLPENLRNPILILEGQHPKTIVVVTELKNKDNNNILVPIALDLRGVNNTVNKVTSIYGKDDISKYLNRHKNQILAYNKEKADKLFTTIGFQLSQTTSAICFNNSIAYTIENVKYPAKEKEEKVMTEQEMIAQVEERLRKEFQEKFSDMESKFNSLNEQVQTINNFISAMTESQSFEQTMNEIESVTKQLTNCDNATFYCYDNSNGKFFSHGDYRNWQEEQAAEELKSVFDSKEILSDGKEAVIPLVSSSGNSLGVIVAEKEGGFTPDDYNSFRQGCPVVNTVELALKKEAEYQGRITDELTHLKNRQGLNDYLENTLCGNVNSGKSVSILMCDIDHFKNVNDTYGHDAGDVILKGVADVLQEGTRSGADCAFRMGGEEMVCILNCPPEKAMDIAERLREKVENTVHHITVNNEPVDVKVTVSMGLHGMTPDLQITPENAREVFDREFKNADIAVYQAKETGRNKVVAADENVYVSYLALKSAEILCSEEPENIESFQKQVKKSLDLDRFPEVTEALQAYAEEHPEMSAAAESIIPKLVDLSGTYVKEERETEEFDLSQLYDEEEIEVEENTMNEQEGKEPTYFNKEGYKNIQNKEYINTDSKTAYLISVKAQEQGIEHSVKYYGKQSAVTVDGVKDKAFVEAVRKEFNIPENSRHEKAAEKPVHSEQQSQQQETQSVEQAEENAPQEKAPTYYNREGFKDIRNREYINTDSKTAYEISLKAQEQGIEHSVKYYGKQSAVTVDGVKDKAFVEAVRKEFNIPENSRPEKAAEKPAPEQSKSEDVQKKAPTFFNKEGYKDIQNKTFLQTDSKTAYEISKAASKQGIEHSVKYYGKQSAVTVDGVKDRAFIDTVKNMSDWAGKVQEKAIKEQAKENQQKNNDAR